MNGCGETFGSGSRIRDIAPRIRSLLAALVFAGLTPGCDTGGRQTTDVAGKLPDLEFALAGESGATMKESELAGQVVMMYFGYTSCPDVCPITLARLKRAMQSLEADERERITVLFVSVDPERDTPERLAQYTSAFGPRFVGATSGELTTLRELTSRYASSFSHGEPDAGGHYPVNHGSSVYVFDRAGRAQLIVRPDDQPEAITHDLRQLL